MSNRELAHRLTLHRPALRGALEWCSCSPVVDSLPVSANGTIGNRGSDCKTPISASTAALLKDHIRSTPDRNYPG